MTVSPDFLPLILLLPYGMAFALLVAGIVIMVRRLDIRWRAAHFCACSAVWLWGIGIALWKFFGCRELSFQPGAVRELAGELGQLLIMSSTFSMTFAFSLVVSGVVMLTAAKSPLD